jgi:hypothetical protein
MTNEEQQNITYEQFQKLIRDNYQPVAASETARAALHRIRQTGTVQAYNTAYLRHVNMITDMSVADQLYLYKQGLQPHIAREVGIHRPTSFMECMNLAQRIEIEQRTLRPNQRNQYTSNAPRMTYASSTATNTYPTTHVQTFSAPVPMEVATVDIQTRNENTDTQHHQEDQTITTINALNRSTIRSPLTPQERQECMQKGLCFYCRQRGHLSRQCPSKNVSRQ